MQSHCAVEPLPSASPSTSGTSTWTGSGESQHLESLDVTQWHNVKLQLQMNWSGACTLTGSGVSVLHRSALAATEALQALVAEERQRQLQVACRFPGDAYRIGDGSKVTFTTVEPHTICTAPPQSYEGIDCTKNIVVPFLLLGSLNMKTGVVHLEKVHIRYVYNNITYCGQVRVMATDARGQRMELHRDALMRQLETGSSGLPLQLQLDLTSCGSKASVLVNTSAAIAPSLPHSYSLPERMRRGAATVEPPPNQCELALSY